MFVYTIQPVVKPVVKRFDNRLYRVYKHSTGCQTCLTTGLTTGWMFVYTIQPVVSCKRGKTLHYYSIACRSNLLSREHAAISLSHSAMPQSTSSLQQVSLRGQ